MSINLASRLAAVTTDFAGVNHIAWVEGNAIWHAQYDANAGTWVNARVAVQGIPGDTTSLNLVASKNLINGSSPGLAVIWQAGNQKANASSFYYSAAQYDENGQLQWDGSSTQFTVNEANDQPFANLAPKAVADNIGNITVAGQQVNVSNAANQLIREDTDLYSSLLTIGSVTPAKSSGAPTALYQPPVLVNGINQGPGTPINNNTTSSQSVAATSFTSAAQISNQTSLLSANESSDASGQAFEGIGFKFGPTLSFSTDLYKALGLNKYVSGVPGGVLKLTLEPYDLVGILTGGTGLGELSITSLGTIERFLGEQEEDPTELKRAALLPKTEKGESASFFYSSETAFDGKSPFDLLRINDILRMSLLDKIPIADSPGGLWSGKLDLIGSVGIQAQLKLEPTNTADDNEEFVRILLEDLIVDGQSVLLTAIGTQLTQGKDGVAGALIASTVFAPIENLLIGSLSDVDNLTVTEFLVGPTIGAELEGTLLLAEAIKMTLAAGVNMFVGFDSQGDSTTVLSIPLEAGFSLGPIGFNVSIEPTWTYPSNAPLPNANSATSALTASAAPASLAGVSADENATGSTPTASVMGNLLTLSFGAPLDTSKVPAASSFGLQTQASNQANPVPYKGTIGNVSVSNDPSGNGIVVLQLSQPLVYSPQFEGANPEANGEQAITIDYSGNEMQFADNTPVGQFSDLNVSNNSPTSLAAVYNPAFGSGLNYAVGNQQPLLGTQKQYESLEADFAQDGPPALTLISSNPTTEGQILAVWSKEVQPITPLAGFVDGNQIYLNFVQALANSTPKNSQFSITISNSDGSTTAQPSNVAIEGNGYILIDLSDTVLPTDSVSLTYELTVEDQASSNLYLTDALGAQLWVPEFTLSLTNTTGQSGSSAPSLLGGSVIITNSDENLVTLAFSQELNENNTPSDSQLTVTSNGVTFAASNISVAGNTVSFKATPTTTGALIGQGAVAVVTYTQASTADQNITGSNGMAVAEFTQQTLSTVAPNPTTSLMAGLWTPGSTSGLSNFQNIIGTDGFNLDPALASDTNGNALAVWVYADASGIVNLSVPGTFYSDEQKSIINNSLSESDIYYSYWDGTQWSIANFVASEQPGTDSNVTVGYDAISQTYLAAWLNTQTDSTSDEETITIYWASYDPSGNGWSTVNTVLTEARPDPLTDLVISSMNGQPALFWTETQPISYAQLTNEDNPDLYFRLGERNGSTATNSGLLGPMGNGTYNGSYQLGEPGALYNSSDNSGDPNRAVLFSDGGNMTLDGALATSGTAFSIEFWFKVPEALSNANNLVSLDGVFDVTLNRDLSITFALSDSTSIGTNILATPIQTNTWNYVVGTYSNQTQELSLYVNGQQVVSTADVIFNPPANAALTIAGGEDAVVLDEVALYSSVLSYSPEPSSPETANSLDLLNSIFGTNQIGEKYAAQYVAPLPPGPQLQVSILDPSGGISPTWSGQNNVIPLPFLQATTLSDANVPAPDIVSNTAANLNGSVSPNGDVDTVYQISLNGQQTQTISGISITVNGISYVAGASYINIGTAQDPNYQASALSGNQLGVVVGDSLINTRNPESTITSLGYTVLGPEVALRLYVDTGSGPSLEATNVTVYYEPSSPKTAPPATTTVTPNPNPLNPSDSGLTPSGVSVLGTATVTETEDSSLTLIDSGFVINTANPVLGYAVISADFNNDGLSDVAVGNRGYTDISGNVLNNGTIQVLMGGQAVLNNSSSGKLSVPTSGDSSAAVSGNAGGFSIVGIPDGGQANGNSALSMATGDVNADGTIDLIIGSPNNNAVYVINGSNFADDQAETVIDVSSLSTEQGYVISPETTLSQTSDFGFAVAVGNWNDSSGADIAIGAPNASNGQGQVFIAYDGSGSASLVYTGSSYTNPTTSTTIGAQAGYALAASSPISNAASFSGSTTISDLIIGAPGYVLEVQNNWSGVSGIPPNNDPNPFSASTPVNVGAIYVLTDASGVLNPSPTFTYYGTDAKTPSANGAAQPLFAGSAVASNGDWNGDGQLDLAIAAPGDNENNGTVFVLSGQKASPSGDAQILNQVSNLTLNGGLPLGQVGAVVSAAGDINDDGYTDFLVTAPQGANAVGQGYVVFGGSELFDGSGNNPLNLNPVANDSKTTFLLNGNFPYQLTGQAAAPIGDINGDGVDDLMITAPNANQLYAVYGHPWLADDGSIKLANISGDNGFVTDGSLYSTQASILAGTGKNVVMLGDVNGDGFADLISGGSPYGAILTFGASTQNLLDAATGTDTLIVTVANNGSIKNVVAAGDVNGDGLADFGVIDQNNNFYLSLGSEALGPQQTLSLDPITSLANTSAAAALGDYNGDGYDDLLLNVSGQQLVYWGNSQGSLDGSGSSRFDANSNTVFSRIGDINGDGFEDVGGGAPSTPNGGGSVYYGSQAVTGNPGITLVPPAAGISAPLQTDAASWQTNNFDEQQQTKFNGAPSLVVYDNYLYMGYTGVNNSSDNGSPFIQRSADGVNWEGLTNFQSTLGQASTGLSFAVFQGNLYVAYLNDSAELMIALASPADNDLGLEFATTPFKASGVNPSYVSPALAVFDDTLYAFFAYGGEYESGIQYFYSVDGSDWQLGSTPFIPSAYLPLGASFAVTTDANNLYLSYATGNGSKNAQGQTFATYNNNSGWSYSSISDSTLRGTGLIDLGVTFYNFYLPDSQDINVISSTTPNQSWSASANIEALSLASNTNWLTYPNPVLFQEKIYLGYGIQYLNEVGGGVTNVFVSYGSSNHVYQPNNTQQFGQQVESIGDFNGDGIADFAVLAPGYFSNMGVTNNQTYENNQGGILIYYGSSTELDSSSNPDIVLAAPAPTAATNIAANQALLLTQLAAAGDVNGDGYDDLIVASPNTALNTDNTTDGVAFVIFGGDSLLWGKSYTATNPFDLGIVTNNTSQLTLDFVQPLLTSSIPDPSAFSVNSNVTQVQVESLTVDSNQVILTLNGSVDLSNFVSVTYTPPSSGGLKYDASGNPQVLAFTASNDAAINTSGAITLGYDRSQVGQNQFGFLITGLPASQAGISLNGGGDVNGDGFSDFLIGAPGDNDNLAYTLFGSDFNQTVNQTGTIGDDVMVGSPTGESFVAGQGNDLIATGGGVDVVYSGPGNDQVIVNDMYFQRLDGGAGLDALFLQGYYGQDWDLTTLSPGLRLKNLEILVTEDYGANTLTLNALTVTQLSPDNTLTVVLDEADSLELSSDFSLTGTVYQYSRNFQEFTSSISAATVLVNQPASSVQFNAPSNNSPAPIITPSKPGATSSTAFSATSLTSSGREDSGDADSSEGENVATATSFTATNIKAQTSDSGPTQIYVSNPTVSELNGQAEFIVTRTGDLNKAVLISYLTQDGDGKAGDRYLPVTGQLIFAQGETSKTVTVPIPNNHRFVGDRQFGLLVTLLKESHDSEDLPRSFDVTANSMGQQIRRWNRVKDTDQPGLFDGILQFDAVAEDGKAQVDLMVTGIGEFNTFYNYDSRIDAYAEFMLNADATGAIFTHSSQVPSSTPDVIGLRFDQADDSRDVGRIINGLASVNGYASRTIPGLITNNKKTFWAPTAADGQVQWRLIGTPSADYELGWIPVDDQTGSIDGLTPTDAGYEAAALRRKQIIFEDQNRASQAALDRSLAQESFTNPSSLSTTEAQFFGNLSDSELEANRFYMLYATQANETTFSVDSAIDIRSDSRGYHQLSFNGITAEIGSSTIVTPGAFSQSLPVEASLSRAASFNNLVALYQVDSLTGGLDTNGDQIIDLLPGESGYTEASLKRAQDSLTGITLATPKNLGASQQSIELLGNSMYGVVVIPNATIEQVLNQNPTNNPNQDHVAFFSFAAANPDGLGHMARLGNNLFGFEDLLGGGDKDYNDIILQLDFPASAIS